jgi:hypothetical protein
MKSFDDRDMDGSAEKTKRMMTRGPTLFHDSHGQKTMDMDQDDVDRRKRMMTRGPTLFNDSHGFDRSPTGQPNMTRSLSQGQPNMTRSLSQDKYPSKPQPVTRGKTILQDEEERGRARSPNPAVLGQAKTQAFQRSGTSQDRSLSASRGKTMGAMADVNDGNLRAQGQLVNWQRRANSVPPEVSSVSRTKSRFIDDQDPGHGYEFNNMSTDISGGDWDRSFSRTQGTSSPMQLSRGTEERLAPKKWSSPMEKIHGGHYEYIVGHRERTAEDAAKRELDQDLLMMLAPDVEIPEPRLRTGTPGTTSAPLMRTAFTDRTLRLRDELGKTVLTGGRPLQVDDPTKECKDCECPSCKPFDRHAAGLPSTLLPGNKASKPKDGKGGKTMNSALVGTAIHKMFEELPAEARQESHAEELLLKKQFGMKRSRPQSAEPGSAGNFNGAIGRESPTRRGRMEQVTARPPRSDLAMILNPSKDDAPAPLRITKFSKGLGECKTPSEEAENLSIKWNQPLYRFELCAGEEYKHPRAVSLPPPRVRNPVNNEGVGIEDCQLGKPERGDRKTSSRLVNDSSNMNTVTNLHVAKELADRERAMRLQHDKKFADLCAMTSEAKEKQAQIHCDIIQRNHHSWSNKMAETLRWGDA